MATYDQPIRHEDHYIERDTSGMGAGFWAALAIIVAVVLFLLFSSGLFSRNRSNSGTGTDIQGSGSVNTPSGNYNGSGSVNTQ